MVLIIKDIHLLDLEYNKYIVIRTSDLTKNKSFHTLKVKTATFYQYFVFHTHM